MYTAKIQRTEEAQAGLDVYVDFYNDGVFSHTENVIPQDRQGFLYWKESRLKSLNARLALKPELTTGIDITNLTDTVPVDTRTQAEKDRDAWLVKYHRWVSIKNNLIDTGVVPANNTQVVAFLEDVKTGFKPGYINFI